MSIYLLLQTYSLRRLARGLSSGRQGARQGFATALTMLISSCGPCLDAAGVMTLIEVVLDGANKGGVSPLASLCLTIEVDCLGRSCPALILFATMHESVGRGGVARLV